MNPILKFLASLRSLKSSGVIKSVDEAYDFAKREFGEINDLFKRQIEEIFNKPKGGITSIKREPKGEVIEASFKPGMDKRGRVVEESPSQASGIMSKIEESGKKLEGAANRMAEIQKEIDAMYKPKPDTSPLMERLGGGIETLKQMKQPGMDLVTGLTRTSVRKILDRAGIKVPDKVDPIEVFEKNFGGDALMDVKDVAEEMIELERMGRSLKSMDEILEQSGMFNIKRNPDAPKGLSDEEIERIKKEVDQEKQLEDFDPKDRPKNAMGGFQRTGFADGPEDPKKKKGIMKVVKKIPKVGKTVEAATSLYTLVKGKKNLLKKIKQSVEDIFTTGDPKYDADVAIDNMFEDLGVDRDMFDIREVLDAYGMAYDELKKPFLAGLKNKPKPFPKTADDVKKEAVEKYGIKPERADEIMNTQFDEKNLDDILNDVDETYGVTPDMKKELDEMAKLTPKAAERFELKMKYPGLDENLITFIVDDPNPQRKAEVLATIDQAFELMKRGKSPDEILSILKRATDRTKQATGGLSYLMGM